MTRKTISAQAVFNQAYRGLMKQGRRSLSDDGKACLYRGPNGLKCGVGHVVTDAECDGWDSRYGNSAVTLYSDGLLPERLRPHIGLLVAIQCAHDTLKKDGPCKGELDRAMRKVAHDQGLKIPAL